MQPSNAKQVPLDDKTKALFDALERFDRIRVINAPTIHKTYDTMPNETIIDNITDDGSPHKYTNGKPAGEKFKAGKDAGLPTSTPPEHPELVNFSTEKPTITLDDFLRQNPGTMICAGVAYYARAGYNRHGIGTPKRFVAIKGGGGESWAIYVGPILAPLDWVASDGDKAVLEDHVKQLIDCEETISYYRF